MLNGREMAASGKRAVELADALNAVNFKILQLTKKEPLYVSTIAKRLDKTEPYISECVQLLQDLNLVTINYQPGNRGVRKVVSCNIEKITLLLKEEETETK